MKPAVFAFLFLWMGSLFQGGRTLIFSQQPALVDLKPDDVDICTTQYLTMTCTIEDQNFHVKDLVFQLNNVNVKSERIDVIDNYTASLSMNISRIEKTVSCCLDNCTIFTSLDTVIMQIFEMPVPISSMSCIIFDFYHNVTCKWDYGADYSLDSVWPTVTFFVGILETDSIANWTIDKLETKAQFVNASDLMLFTQEGVRVGLSITSSCGISVNRTFQGADIIKVKPKPVTQFKSRTLNSTCIQLSWKHNRPTLRKSYNISALCHWGERQVYLNETSYNKNINETTFCDLIPGTYYTFTIAVDSLEEKKPGIWSQLQETKNKTHDDVPGSSPAVVEGGYSWNRDDCRRGVPLRVVYIYWKNGDYSTYVFKDENIIQKTPIPPVHDNGMLEGTLLNFTSKEYTESVLLTDIRATFLPKSLSCNTGYNVTIQTQNNVGLSLQPSSFMITSADNDASHDLLVERSSSNSSVVYLEWAKNDTASTVFYIEKNGLDPDCGAIVRGQIYWNRYAAGSTSSVLNLPQGKDPELFCFARSVESPIGNAGFEWSACLYVKDIAPTHSPADLKVTTGSKDNTLVLTWSKWLCRSGEPFISLYEISYCIWKPHTNCSEHPAIVSYKKEQTTAVIADLDSEEQYELRIRAMSRTGKRGPWSESVIGKSKDGSLKQDAVIGIAFGSLFGGIVFISCLVCSVRYCRKKASHKLKSLKEIGDPEVRPDPVEAKQRQNGCILNTIDIPRSGEHSNNNDSKPNLILRQNSKDSGIHEGPLTPDSLIESIHSKISDTIPEDYKKAEVESSNQDYVKPKDIVVATVEVDTHNSNPSSNLHNIDSYVRVKTNDSKNGSSSPIVADRIIFGNDNQAFTDDHGNKNEKSTKTTKAESVPGPIKPVQTTSEITKDTSCLIDAKEVKILNNCLITIPRPKLFDQDNETVNMAIQNDSNVNPKSRTESNLHQGISDYVTTDSLAIPNSFSVEKNTVGRIVSLKLQSDNQPIKSDHFKATPQHTRFDNGSLDTELHSSVCSIPDVKVQNQSDLQINTSGYVSNYRSLPSLQNQSCRQEDKTGYVSLPSIQNQSCTQENKKGYVSLPSIQNQSFTQEDKTGYVSPQIQNLTESPVQSQSNKPTDISCCVSKAPTPSESDVLNKGSSLFQNYSQGIDQTKSLGYLSHIPTQNNHERQQQNHYICQGSEFSHPYLHNHTDEQIQNQSESKAEISDCATHRPLLNQSEGLTNTQPYIETNMHSYVPHPTVLNKSEGQMNIQPDIETNMHSYVPHPTVLNKSEGQINIQPNIEINIPGYDPHTPVQNQSKCQINNQTDINNGFVIQDDRPGYVSHPPVQNQSESRMNNQSDSNFPIVIQNDRPGYVSHPPVQNQCDSQMNNQSDSIFPIVIQNDMTGYVLHPPVQNQSNSQINKQPDSNYRFAVQDDRPNYVPHLPVESQVNNQSESSNGFVNQKNIPGYVFHPPLQN